MIGVIAAGGAGWTPLLLGSKLRLWVSAEYMASVGSGGSVTSWTDLSGNGRHLTLSGTAPTYQTTGGGSAGDKKCLRFPGTGFYVAPISVLSGLTSTDGVEMFVNWRATTHSSGKTMHNFSNNGQQNHHAYLDGVIYDGFCSTSRRSIGPLTAVSVWNTYHVRSLSSEWVMRLSGVTQQAGSAAFQNPSGGGALYIGGGYQTMDGYYGGVVVTTELTSAERLLLDTFMTNNPSGGTP